MCDSRAALILLAEGFLADGHENVLEGVYGHDHAYQILRQPAFRLAPEVVEQVGIVEVHLVDPDLPDSITFSCQESTVENTLWRHR